MRDGGRDWARRCAGRSQVSARCDIRRAAQSDRAAEAEVSARKFLAFLRASRINERPRSRHRSRIDSDTDARAASLRNRPPSRRRHNLSPGEHASPRGHRKRASGRQLRRPAQTGAAAGLARVGLAQQPAAGAERREARPAQRTQNERRDNLATQQPRGCRSRPERVMQWGRAPACWLDGRHRRPIGLAAHFRLGHATLGRARLARAAPSSQLSILFGAPSMLYIVGATVAMATRRHPQSRPARWLLVMLSSAT